MQGIGLITLFNRYDGTRSRALPVPASTCAFTPTAAWSPETACDRHRDGELRCKAMPVLDCPAPQRSHAGRKKRLIGPGVTMATPSSIQDIDRFWLTFLAILATLCRAGCLMAASVSLAESHFIINIP
jgi:hypothetical protein